MTTMTPKEFAAKIMKRVEEENYDSSLFLVICAISDKVVEYQRKELFVGANRLLFYDDFCNIIGYDFPKKGLSKFIRETSKELEVLIQEDLKKEPENMAYAMKKVLLYGDFVNKVEVENASYTICRDIVKVLNNYDNDVDKAMGIAVIFDNL